MNYKPGDRAVNPQTGEAFVFNGQEWVKEDRQPEPSGMGKVAGALAQLNQGLFLGFNDEIQGALGATGDLLTGKGWTYRERQQANEAAQRQYEGDNPLLSGTMRAVGAAAPVLATMGAAAVPQLAGRTAGLMGQVAQGARTGAGLGMVNQLGEATPEQVSNPTGMLGQAATGALVGGAIGGAVPMAVEGVSRLIEPARRLSQYVRRVVGGDPSPAVSVAPGRPQPPLAGLAGRERALGALEDANMTPMGAAEALQQGRAAGQPLSIADVAGRPTQRLVRGARALPGPAAETVDTRLAARQAGQEGRVAGEMQGLAGVEPLPYGASRAVRQLAEDSAEPYYTAARPQVLDDPRIWRQLRSAPVYREAHEATRQELLRVRPQEAPPALFDERGGLLRKPTVNDVDIIKKNLDDRLYDANGNFRMTEQSARDKLVSGPLEGARRELVDLVDDAAPDYATARGYYDNAYRFRTVTEAGETALGKAPAQIAEELAEMSPPEREVYRRAALAQAFEKMRAARGKADVPNVLKSVYGWGEGLERDRLRALFGGDTAALARFEARMNRELDMVRTRNYVAGGSQTADKMADQADIAGFDLGTAAVDAKTGGLAQVWSAARNAVGGRATTGLGADARGELADILTRGADDEVLAFLRELEGVRVGRALRQPASTFAGGAGSLAATGD